MNEPRTAHLIGFFCELEQGRTIDDIGSDRFMVYTGRAYMDRLMADKSGVLAEIRETADLRAELAAAKDDNARLLADLTLLVAEIRMCRKVDGARFLDSVETDYRCGNVSKARCEVNAARVLERFSERSKT